MPTEDEKLYSVWTSMKSRCANSNDKDYEYYGGKGIRVCKRWQESFENFKKDMGPRKPGQTIERKNNNGNYEPANCYWADRAAQAKNRGYNQTDLFAKTFEFDAEIFATGTWNGDKYTESDITDLVENFNALTDTVKPPVKLGHKWKEGQPALGWVKALKKVGNKVVATLTDVPEIVYDAIKAGRYKRVSSEIYWNFKSAAGKTFNYVLRAVALLGADIPAVDNLEDLTAYLSQHFPQGTGQADEVRAYESKLDNEFKIVTIKHNKEQNVMSDKEIKEYMDKIDAEKKAKEAALKEADAVKAELKKFKEDQAKAEVERKTKEFTSDCEALVKAGKMTPAERDNIVKEVEFTETGVVLGFASLKQFIENRQLLDTKEQGKDEDKKEYASASAELADRAKKYSREHKVDYEVAVKDILESDRELADRYKME